MRSPRLCLVSRGVARGVSRFVPRCIARCAALGVVLFATAACDPFAPAPTGSGAQATPGMVQLVLRTQPGDIFRFHRLSTDGVRVFTGSEENGVLAIDAMTGEVVWRVTGVGEDFLGEPIVGGARVFAAGQWARAWRATTGELLWEYELNASARLHLGYVADDVFFIGTDTVVYALDGATGAVRWRTGIGADWAYDGRVRSIAGAGDALYVCAGEPVTSNGWQTRGHIIALDRTTGAIRWRHVMSYENSYSFCLGEPTVAGDVVVVGDAGGNNFVAVDRATGAFRWRHAGDPEWVGPYVSPVASGDTLFAASNDKRVLALERSSGRVLWEMATDGSAWHVTPCGKVLLASDMSLWVLDSPTGRVLGKNVQLNYGRGDLLSSRFLVHAGYAYAVGGGRFYKWRCPT